MRAKHSYYILLLVISASLMLGCGGGGNNRFSSETNSTQVQTTADYKQAELDFIQTELKARHPNLFFKRSESDFDLDVEELKANSAQMSDIEFRLASTKLVATIGDQHTYMIMHEPTMKQFPFEVWWIDDKAIITQATESYRNYLGYELVSIDATPLVDMKDIAMQYLAHENPYWKNALSPMYLRYAELLYYEGLIASPDSASFELKSPDGNVSYLDIPSEYEPDYLKIEATQETVPLYRRSQQHYWFSAYGDIMYIQYNRCYDVSGYPLDKFIDDLHNEIVENQPEKIVVDLRFNHGGIIDHFVPVIDYLAASDFNTEDRLFVLTGRHTFSSGVGTTYSFVNATNATFVGTETGGKPNGYSHVIGFNMGVSLNSLYMATSYLEVTDVGVNAFVPDIVTPFTHNDFLTGNDPALAFITGQ